MIGYHVSTTNKQTMVLSLEGWEASMRMLPLRYYLSVLHESEEKETCTMVSLLNVRTQRQLRTLIQDYSVLTEESPNNCRVLLSVPGSPLATLQALVWLWENAYPSKDLPRVPPLSQGAFAPCVKAAKELREAAERSYERDTYYMSHRFVAR